MGAYSFFSTMLIFVTIASGAAAVLLMRATPSDKKPSHGFEVAKIAAINTWGICMLLLVVNFFVAVIV